MKNIETHTTVTWLKEPIPEEPPPRNNHNRRNPRKAAVVNLFRLVPFPGVWHKVAYGNVGSTSARINASEALPGKWEAVNRGGALYVRFMGFD